MTPEQQALADQLTKLQRQTVLNHVTGKMSQREAYYAAGGTAKRDAVADAIVSRMLSDAKVKAFYDSLLAQAVKSSIATREEILERLTLQSRVTITDICDFSYAQVGEDENGNPVYQTVWKMKDSKDIRPEHAACIKSVTVTKTGPKIELFDTTASAKLLVDMQGWQSATKHELTGANGGAIQMQVESKDVADALKDLLTKL